MKNYVSAFTMDVWWSTTLGMTGKRNGKNHQQREMRPLRMCTRNPKPQLVGVIGNILQHILFDSLAAQQLRRDMLLSALTMPSLGLLFILPGNSPESTFHLWLAGWGFLLDTNLQLQLGTFKQTNCKLQWAGSSLCRVAHLHVDWVGAHDDEDDIITTRMGEGFNIVKM